MGNRLELTRNRSVIMVNNLILLFFLFSREYIVISPAGKEILGNETRAGQVRLATSGSFSSSYNLIKLAYLLLICLYLFIHLYVVQSTCTYC